APLDAAVPNVTVRVWLDSFTVGAPGAPGKPMTVAVIPTSIARSGRPGTSVTFAIRCTVPAVARSGVIVTVPPLAVTVAPAGWVTLSTWRPGAASGLVTYCARMTVTLWLASTVTATARPLGGGALITATLRVPPSGPPAPGLPAVAPAGVIRSVPVAPGAAALAAVSVRPVPPGTLALTPPGALTHAVL